jgi:hypothetical protein
LKVDTAQLLNAPLPHIRFGKAGFQYDNLQLSPGNVALKTIAEFRIFGPYFH